RIPYGLPDSSLRRGVFFLAEWASGLCQLVVTCMSGMARRVAYTRFDDSFQPQVNIPTKHLPTNIYLKTLERGEGIEAQTVDFGPVNRRAGLYVGVRHGEYALGRPFCRYGARTVG